MENYSYKTQGVCSMKINFAIAGNTQGIARLVEGMKVDDVIKRLKNTDCRGRGTSCPDQLARALEQARKS